MKTKILIELCLTFSLVYVGMGDLFLPQPYNSNSKQIKQGVNQFLVGLFPEKDFQYLEITEEISQEI